MTKALKQLSVDERRVAARYEFAAFAWYKRIDDAAEASEEGVARSCDISETGVGIVTARALPVGAKVFLKIIAAGASVSAIARVMHCRALENGNFRLGLEVFCVPPTDRQVWKYLCGG